MRGAELRRKIVAAVEADACQRGRPVVVSDDDPGKDAWLATGMYADEVLSQGLILVIDPHTV